MSNNTFLAILKHVFWIPDPKVYVYQVLASWSPSLCISQIIIIISKTRPFIMMGVKTPNHFLVEIKQTSNWCRFRHRFSGPEFWFKLGIRKVVWHSCLAHKKHLFYSLENSFQKFNLHKKTKKTPNSFISYFC